MPGAIGQQLIIRADANSEIGTGHLMRCLALAQAWQDSGGQVTFVTACSSEALLQRLHTEGFDVHLLDRSYPDSADWQSTEAVLRSHPQGWVVLDGYHFDEAYQQHVKESGHNLLVVDDMAHLKYYYADIVLNQNLHAEQLTYSCEPNTTLLLGTHYVLLRREFLAWKDWEREIPEVARHVLVTLGGSDPENHTLKAIAALQEVDVPALEATVVIGAGNPHWSALEEEIKRSRIHIRLIRDAKNMPELMAWADTAISSAGTTVWELLFLGTPIMTLVLADNQCSVAQQIENHGLGISLGWAEKTTVKSLARAIESLLTRFDPRAEASGNARQIVDAEGAKRVIAVMRQGCAPRLELRPASLEDCALFWEWANDTAVRRSAFGSNPIPWGEHVNWFQQKLADPQCLIYVVVRERGIPVGQVRLDMCSDGRAEVDVSIDARERQKGYGSAALRLVCERPMLELNLKEVLAHIRGENLASIAAFAKAGFVRRAARDFKGHEAVEMVWGR